MPLVRIAERGFDPGPSTPTGRPCGRRSRRPSASSPARQAIPCVAERDAPARLRLFEIYADDAASRAPIASPHFRKYAATTKDMILAKRLIDTDPVQLSAKR